jgi:glycerophosphoryl diester phosphodiesterase
LKERLEKPPLMLSQLPKPAIYAHRGASTYAPENTLAAFKLAVEQKADAIELDVKLSADNEVVVIHDQTVKRTTGAPGRVAQLSLAELKELDAGSFFDIKFKGERIPSLGEVFETVGNSVYINIELTNYASLNDDLPNLTAALVKKHGMEKRVLFSSFNPLALIRIHRLLPEVPLGLLTLPGKSGRLLRSPLGRIVPHQALHPNNADTNKQLVDRTHRSGRLVNVWTVNEPQAIRSFISMGVDGIITDQPLLMHQVLNSGRTFEGVK